MLYTLWSPLRRGPRWAHMRNLIGRGRAAAWAAGILHLDSLRIFNSRIKKLGEGEGEAKGIQSPFGVGLLVGALAVRSAYDFGCTKAELLAIKDNDKCAPRMLERSRVRSQGQTGGSESTAACSPLVC
jgi:hypothetical protein